MLGIEQRPDTGALGPQAGDRDAGDGGDDEDQRDEADDHDLRVRRTPRSPLPAGFHHRLFTKR